MFWYKLGVSTQWPCWHVTQSLVTTGMSVGQEGNVQRCLSGIAHTWINFQFVRRWDKWWWSCPVSTTMSCNAQSRQTLCPRAHGPFCLPLLLWEAKCITWAIWKLLSTQNKVKRPIPARCYFTKKEHCVSCSQFLAVYRVPLLVSLSVNTLINFITPACGQNVTNGGSDGCLGTGINHL